MNDFTWIEELPASITVCSTDGTIIRMNKQAIKTFEADGGAELIGKNVLDCHPEPARSKLQELLDTQATNIYTIEKNSIKKLIYQAPWYDNGKYCGIVEMAFEIPFKMPHFKRG